MLQLAELTARVKACPYWLPKDVKWELCGSCVMSVCRPEALGCLARKDALARRQKRASRSRVSNMTKAQIEAQRQRSRNYYAECKDALKVKQRMAYHGNGTAGQPRVTRTYLYQDQQMTLLQISKETGIYKKTLAYRLKHGMTIEQAVTTPVLTRQQAGRQAGELYRQMKGYK